MLAETHELYWPKICFSTSLSSLDWISFCETITVGLCHLSHISDPLGSDFFNPKPCLSVPMCTLDTAGPPPQCLSDVWLVDFVMIFVICHVYLLQTDFLQEMQTRPLITQYSDTGHPVSVGFTLMCGWLCINTSFESPDVLIVLPRPSVWRRGRFSRSCLWLTCYHACRVL